MNFHFLESELRQRLNKQLPGIEAHEKMIPPSRRESIHNAFLGKNGKNSAVLLLLYPHTNSLNFVLIKRARYNGVHSGQIALPGGQYEPQDNDLKYTALREAQEEIGIDMNKVSIVGKLSEIYIPPSNFRVQPFVGFYPEKPVFKVDGIETSRTIEISIKDFMNPDLQTEKMIVRRDGKNEKVPCFYLNGEIVWGATAMILSEFLMVLKDMPKELFISPQ